MKELFKLSNQEQITDDKYTSKISLPQYEIKGEKPHIEELVLTTKVGKLISDIKNSNVTEQEKRFLTTAAYRHLVFNYAKIAEYYAHATKEMQSLMEESALVIIDLEDAIMNGYAIASKKIDNLIKNNSRSKKNEL